MTATPKPKPKPRAPRNTGPDKKTRELVLERDRHRCVRCGMAFRPDNPFGFSIQHRKPRGMGGTRIMDINLPSNLISLCGLPGTPGGCHTWAESRDSLAREYGYTIAVNSNFDPSSVPVRSWFGWVLLGTSGSIIPCPPGQGEIIRDDIRHEDEEPGLAWSPPTPRAIQGKNS